MRMLAVFLVAFTLAAPAWAGLASIPVGTAGVWEVSGTVGNNPVLGTATVKDGALSFVGEVCPLATKAIESRCHRWLVLTAKVVAPLKIQDPKPADRLFHLTEVNATVVIDGVAYPADLRDSGGEVAAEDLGDAISDLVASFSTGTTDRFQGGCFQGGCFQGGCFQGGCNPGGADAFPTVSGFHVWTEQYYGVIAVSHSLALDWVSPDGNRALHGTITLSILEDGKRVVSLDAVLSRSIPENSVLLSASGTVDASGEAVGIGDLVLEAHGHLDYFQGGLTFRGATLDEAATHFVRFAMTYGDG